MPDNYFANYLPLLIHFILAGVLATALVTLSWLIGQRKPSRAKNAPYECGMTPVGDSRQRFKSTVMTSAVLMVALVGVTAGTVCLFPFARSWRQRLGAGDLPERHRGARRRADVYVKARLRHHVCIAVASRGRRRHKLRRNRQVAVT